MTKESRTTRMSSIYPMMPEGSRRLISIPPTEMTMADRLVVSASSLAIVGSVFWFPLVLRAAFKKWKSIQDPRRRRFYGLCVLGALGLFIAGPHKTVRAGKWMKVREWSFWKSWLRFIAMEVILDNGNASLDHKRDKAILAFVPHGIFPFPFAFAIFPKIAETAFGVVRPVVAAATQLFPVVRDFIGWADPIYASRDEIDQALSAGDRVAIVPGGIAEMFEGYPKPGTHPDEEYAIVRKGIMKLAIKHGVPLIPIYCFGSTKLMRRLELPFLETLSRILRVSICIFFGKLGLPIPFRQRLLYVVGSAIYPPSTPGNVDNDASEMHAAFCNELGRIFDRYKELYGWSHKNLKLLDG